MRAHTRELEDDPPSSLANVYILFVVYFLVIRQFVLCLVKNTCSIMIRPMIMNEHCDYIHARLFTDIKAMTIRAPFRAYKVLHCRPASVKGNMIV